jgi:hypothetical protein
LFLDAAGVAASLDAAGRRNPAAGVAFDALRGGNPLLPAQYRARSPWRRELRVRFFSLLCGLAVAAAAGVALSVSMRPEARVPDSPVASRAADAAVSPAKVQAEAADRRAATGATIDAGRVGAEVGSARTIDGGTACAGNGAICRGETGAADKPRAPRAAATNDRSPIAGVLVGRADQSTGTPAEGSWADVPNEPLSSRSSKHIDERPPEVTPQPNGSAADLSNVHRAPPRASRLSRTRNAHRKDASSDYRAGDARETWRSRDNEPRAAQPARSFARDNSVSRNGFWAWSR